MNARLPSSEPAPGVAVAASLRTAAGSSLPVEVTVTNTATEARVLAVGAIGIEAAWVPPLVRTQVLEAGQSAVVTLTITPAIGTVPAQYPLAFTAQALHPETGRPTGTSAAMVDSVLVVNPRNQLSVTLEPRNASLISTKRIRLTLTNGGDQPARVAIGVQASPELLVRFRQKEVDVLPGATREVRGRVRVPRGRLVGGRSTYSYTVSTRGTESVRHVEGSVSQHALIGTGVLKLLAVVAALSIWIAAAVVFVPQLADRLGNGRTDTSTAPVGGDESDSGTGDDSDGGGEGGSSDGAGDKGSDGGKATGGNAQQAADKKQSAVALSGTVAGERPGGVTVSLEPTSLVDEKAQRGVGVGVKSPANGAAGKSQASSFLNRAVAGTAPDRSARTAPDGSWAFSQVRAPGFYLLTFSKAGYQSQSFVVDASSAAAEKPLEVTLAAGEGQLSGTVSGPRGEVGDATVTITDGTTTITTSSNSRTGRWSVRGLSTPATYVVQASKPGLSSESRMVDLAAGGSAGADLRLRHGVATLIGLARAVDESGNLDGIGGAQVTVTGEDGTVHTATTLTRGARSGSGNAAARVTDGFVGSYKVPGLPVPGDYLVTLSGDGLQTQTRKIHFDRGQSRGSVDADLVSAFGSVAGTITGVSTSGAAAGLVGAGLTLENSENTYKTMSTSNPAGGYLFDGVEPGTYTLHTEYFGYDADDVAVRVRAGRPVQVDRRLAEVEGGVLAARSSVRGRAVDGTTSQPITCAGGPTEECLVASVLEPGLEDGTDDDNTYRTRFLAADEFTLPDPLEDPGAGLLPGLHTVRVSAPHYSSAVANVQVSGDSVTDIGTVSLLPAPKIAGFISAAIDAPAAPTCIWAVPSSDPRAPPARCQLTGSGGAPGTSAECQQNDATFSAGATGRVCAYITAGVGSYSIEVPSEGTWTLYIEPGDAEYLQPPSAPILLEAGVTQNPSMVLNRYGRVSVTAVAPNDAGVVAPLKDARITLRDPTNPNVVLVDGGLTDANGKVLIVGVPARVYTARAEVPGGPTGTTTGVTVGLNQPVVVRITSTKPIGLVPGQVTFQFDGQARAVPRAQVQVTAPTRYDDSGVATPGTVTMTTNANGCFLIEEEREVTTPPTPSPEVTVPATGGTCHWPERSDTDPPDGSRAEMTFVSKIASRVSVVATGFVPLSRTEQTLTSTLNRYTLEAQPIALGTVEPVVDSDAPSAGTFDWSQVAFSILPGTRPADATAISVRGTGVGTDGALTWLDSRVGVDDQVLVGSYTVSAHRDGYIDGQGTITCDPTVDRDPVTEGLQTHCVWSGTPLTLKERSSITVTVRSDGVDVPNVQYTLKIGTVAQPSQGSATFTGLDPNVTNYQVEARAAGYAFSPESTTCDTIALQPGADTACTIELEKLGTIKGKITGAPQKPPGTASTTILQNADVKIYECLDTTTVPGKCARRADDPEFTGTTNGSGQFRITGDLTKAGIDEGTPWLVQAEAPSYSLRDPGDGAVPGMLITSSSFTDHEATADLELVLTPVDVSVVLVEGGVNHFTEATVVLAKNTSEGLVKKYDSTVSGTSYAFSGVEPGQYHVVVTGGGLIATSQSILVVDAGTEFPVPVVRAANYVQGTVTTTDPLAPGALPGATVIFCKAATCPTPIKLLDGETSLVTDDSGFFSSRAVPDGPLWIQVSKKGYLTQRTSAAVVFNHLLAPPASIPFVLPVVTRKVLVTVTPSWSDDPLDGTTVTLKNGDVTKTADTFLEADDGSYVATFNQVQWGCWKVGVKLPKDHFGTVGALQNRPTDADIAACTQPDEMKVPTEPTFPPPATLAPATASLTVTESPVDIAVTATARATFGHADPTEAWLVVADDTEEYLNEESELTRTLWLPPGGGYTVTAKRAETADPFWVDAVDDSVRVPDDEDDGAATVALALTEGAATLTVTLTGALDTTTLALTPPAGESVPTDFDPTSLVVDLTRGEWTVTVTSTRTTTDDEGETTTTTRTATDTVTIAEPGPVSLPLTLVE